MMVVGTVGTDATRIAVAAAVGVGFCGYLWWRWSRKPNVEQKHTHSKTDAKDCSYHTFAYGDRTSEQFFRVYPPCRPLDSKLGKRPTAVVIIHGGYWKAKYAIDSALHGTLAPFLANEGFIAVDVEYRRVGHVGGGWPGTGHDIADAYFGLKPALQGLGLLSSDTSNLRTVVLGHSAGGQLALWLSSFAEKLATENPEVTVPELTVAISPVTDLVAGHHQRLSDDGTAIERFMKGTPEQLTDEYAAASPAALLPTKVPAVVAIGDSDVNVPPALVQQYAKDAKAAGCRVEHLEIEGADHFVVVTADEPAWRKIYTAMCRWLTVE